MMVNPIHVKTADPFESLFPIDQQTLNAIIDDMKANGFDVAHPLIVWKERGVLIDGHTRRVGACTVGLDVPVVERSFQSEDDAVAYAIHCQRNRRNLTDADMFRFIAELDKRKARGGDRKSEESKAQPCAIDHGKSAEATAATVGASTRKVEQARTILEHADEETKAAVLNGERSINAAYRETQAKRKPQTAPTMQVIPPRHDPSVHHRVDATDGSGAIDAVEVTTVTPAAGAVSAPVVSKSPIEKFDINRHIAQFGHVVQQWVEHGGKRHRNLMGEQLYIWASMQCGFNLDKIRRTMPIESSKSQKEALPEVAKFPEIRRWLFWLGNDIDRRVYRGWRTLAQREEVLKELRRLIELIEAQPPKLKPQCQQKEVEGEAGDDCAASSQSEFTDDVVAHG